MFCDEQYKVLPAKICPRVQAVSFLYPRFGTQLGLRLALNIIATLGLEERPILEDGPSGLVKSDLTNHPPTPVDMDCCSATTCQIKAKL